MKMDLAKNVEEIHCENFQEDLVKELTKDFYKVMEVYFDKQIIFPYMFLKDIHKAYQEQYDDCNIYMLMLCDKLEMIEATQELNYFIVKYKNISSGEVETLKMYYREWFGVDIPPQCIRISIEKFGQILKIEVQKEIFDRIKFMSGLPNDMSNILITNIYDLINLCKKDVETCENYNVIYIGQSNPKAEYRTIFDRLEKHEKITEVFRDYNLEYRDKELMVCIMHAKSKLHNIDGLLALGSTEWNQYDMVGEKIDNAAIIDITEAMLIYHFKPLYNIKLKDSMPNVDMKKYNQIMQARINRVEVQLNLFLDSFQNSIRLITKNQKTVSKLRTLRCNIDELYQIGENTDILYEDIDDRLYDMLLR